MPLSFDIGLLSASDLEGRMTEFAELLHACVHDDASINFILPFGFDQAEAFWRTKVLPRLDGGRLYLMAVLVDGRLAGSVQLDCDTPPNQPHRADVKKVLVHPDFRRRGLGRALLAAAEAEARRQGRHLLTLDTRTGDRGEPLYLAAGYMVAGIVPGYALNIHSTGYDDATFLYKVLAEA